MTMTVSQEKLQHILLPKLKNLASTYKKIRPVHARQAKTAESIVTIVDDKEETRNTAAAGDFIVKNLTRSAETYIVSKNKFPKLYELSKVIDDTWSEYTPKGKVKALEVTAELISLLEVQSPFFISAPWGEEQRVEVDDYFVASLNELDKIYRIECTSFKETYQPLAR